jgi:3-oxoacyl-[acyl-carrier protein] reductase
MQTKSVAIVTGASQGIGRTTAMRLARDFQVVVLAARHEDELKKTAVEVQSAGAETLTYTVDLRGPRSSEIIVQGTLDRFGGIDALLNIAGAVPQTDLFEMTDAQWKMAWLMAVRPSRLKMRLMIGPPLTDMSISACPSMLPPTPLSA